MKKSILILGLIFSFQMETMAQQKNQFNGTGLYNTATPVLLTSPHYDPVKDYDYYMQKKKKNLTAGVVTLGAGVLLSGIGLIVASSTSAFDDGTAPAVLLIAGAVSGIVSIPLMIMSTVYGRKAKLELSKQKTGFGVPLNRSKDIVGLTLKIGLGN